MIPKCAVSKFHFWKNPKVLEIQPSWQIQPKIVQSSKRRNIFSRTHLTLRASLRSNTGSPISQCYWQALASIGKLAVFSTRRAASPFKIVVQSALEHYGLNSSSHLKFFLYISVSRLTLISWHGMLSAIFFGVSHVVPYSAVFCSAVHGGMVRRLMRCHRTRLPFNRILRSFLK
jgi:hypothetical protein